MIDSSCILVIVLREGRPGDSGGDGAAPGSESAARRCCRRYERETTSGGCLIVAQVDPPVDGTDEHAPPMILPMVTGRRLENRNWPLLTLAPFSIPSGMKNMLAIECSIPMATKVMIGNQMARILPAMSSAPMAIHTARTTSQLQPTPRRMACIQVSDTLASAMAADALPRSPPCTSPVQ